MSAGFGDCCAGLAFVVPHPDRWEQNFKALQSEARKALASPIGPASPSSRRPGRGT